MWPYLAAREAGKYSIHSRCTYVQPKSKDSFTVVKKNNILGNN